MIAIALFAAAGVLCVLAGHWRENTVPQEGSLRPDRVTKLLMFAAICVALAAILLSTIQMVISVTA
jgi:hypothetical protein